VKPLALMRWLIRLVTTKEGVILDPFAGSGTTGLAAICEERRFVGVELNADYAVIARRRIAAGTGPLFEGQPEEAESPRSANQPEFAFGESAS